MSGKECYFDDVRHHFNSIDALLQAIEDKNAVLKRGIDRLGNERDMWESRANEQLAETEKLENEVLVLKREVECLNETVSEQKGINYELGEMVQRYFIKNDKLEKQIDSLKIENRMNRNLRTRHEIESAIWKFIFEHGICSLEEFAVRFDENDDTYVFILTNSNWRLDEEDFEILRPTLINNYGKNTSVLITAHRASYENAMKAGKYHCGWN
jgi:chromosome segregation ATPase